MFHLLLGNDYDKELTPRVVCRRMCVWAVLSAVAGAPSFVVAQSFGHFDTGAMLLGVLIFILLLTVITSNTAFNRLYRQPAVRRAIHIAIYTRLSISIVFPVALIIEFPAGLFSVQLVSHMGYEWSAFTETLVITLVQGSILLALLLFYPLIVYGIVSSSAGLAPSPASTRCVDCGYDLRGNPSAIMCPECGAEVSAATRALIADGARQHEAPT